MTIQGFGENQCSKRLQFDERNKSLGCCVRITFTVALEFNGIKEMNSSQTH